MSHLQFFANRRLLVRDAVIGLTVFSALAVFAIADRAQSGRSLMPLQPSEITARLPVETGNGLKMAAARPWLRQPSAAPPAPAEWRSTALPGQGKTSLYQVLIPLGLVFAIAFTSSAALLRHIVRSFAVAPISQRHHRSDRRHLP